MHLHFPKPFGGCKVCCASTIESTLVQRACTSGLAMAGSYVNTPIRHQVRKRGYVCIYVYIYIYLSIYLFIYLSIQNGPFKWETDGTPDVGWVGDIRLFLDSDNSDKLPMGGHPAGLPNTCRPQVSPTRGQRWWSFFSSPAGTKSSLRSDR